MDSSPWVLKELDTTERLTHMHILLQHSHDLAMSEASLVAQMVNNPPAMQETEVQSLGQEDPLEKGMETHTSILAWKTLWTEEPGRLQFMESQKS